MSELSRQRDRDRRSKYPPNTEGRRQEDAQRAETRERLKELRPAMSKATTATLAMLPLLLGNQVVRRAPEFKTVEELKANLEKERM